MTMPRSARNCFARRIARCIGPSSVAATRCVSLGTLTIAAMLLPTARASAQTRNRISIRGHEQVVLLYGPPTGQPVIVSSGDGGWIHLGPHVAEVLAARGYFVVGFDVRAYLASFTTRRSAVRMEDEPGDYRTLVRFASGGTGRRPILIGVSEGAGLSVLAAADPATKAEVAGVIGLGLPDANELGWRWKDMVIYLTHRSPAEPAFRTASVIDRLAPLPLAAIHSTRDEFVPLAEVERLMAAAREPKRLWIVLASNHRFSDKLDEFDRRLLDAMAWVNDHAPR